MSQERTTGQLVGEAWTKIQVLRDEIDRLTAKVQDRDEVIKEWERRFGTRTNTAWKALGAAHAEIKRRADYGEQRDKEIDRLNAENESLRQTLARYFSDAKTVADYERTEDELRVELDAGTAEIERLRAALEEAESDINELLVNSESPTFIEQYAPQAKAEIRAALKGAE